MAKLIQFPSEKQQRMGPQIKKLLRISDEIDAVLRKHALQEDVDLKELAGILAHRLGVLMRHVDEKSKVWSVCEKVLKKQAALD